MAAIQYIDRAGPARVSPGARTLARAAIAALTAPSIFNSQPWRWPVGAEAAHLRADRRRHITPIDPTATC